MPQIIACPFCQQQFTIAEDQYAGYVNSQVTCSGCHRTFTVVQEGSQLRAVDPATAPPIAMTYATGAGMQSPPTNGLAIAGLVCSIAGLVTCGFVGAAGIICSILGLRRSKQTGTGRGLAIAGLVIGIVSVLMLPLMMAILLPSLSRAREKANEIACQSNLRQLGQAIMMYANDNRGYLPPDLSVLSPYVQGTTVYTCPSAKGATLTSGSVSTNYIYLGRSNQKISAQMNPAQAVLLYEPLSDHSNDGANFLYFDGHTQFLGKKDAAALIQQLELPKPSIGTAGGVGPE